MAVEAQHPDLPQLVRSELDRLFIPVSHDKLAGVCDEVEDAITLLIKQSIIDEIRRDAEIKHMNCLVSSAEQFTYGDALYELRVTEPPTKPTCIQISILRCDHAKGATNALLKFSLRELGRYRQVEFRIATELRGLQETLAQSISTILQTGYRWLLGHVRSGLESLLKGTSDEVYSYLRKLFSEKSSRNIWLYAIVDKQGIYIPDAIQREVAFTRAAERKLITSHSPLELVSRLATTALDFDTIFSRIAIQEDQTISRTFTVVPYGETGLQIAEQAVYVTKEYVIQPLVREGKTLLTVGYPIDLRSSVESVLNHERATFKRMIEERASVFRRVMRQIERKTWSSELITTYVGYAGTFLGAAVKSFTGPG